MSVGVLTNQNNLSMYQRRLNRGTQRTFFTLAPLKVLEKFRAMAHSPHILLALLIASYIY